MEGCGSTSCCSPFHSNNNNNCSFLKCKQRDVINACKGRAIFRFLVDFPRTLIKVVVKVAALKKTEYYTHTSQNMTYSNGGCTTQLMQMISSVRHFETGMKLTSQFSLVTNVNYRVGFCSHVCSKFCKLLQRERKLRSGENRYLCILSNFVEFVFSF